MNKTFTKTFFYLTRSWLRKKELRRELLENAEFPEDEKRKLKLIYAKLNPAEIKRNLDKKIARI